MAELKVGDRAPGFSLKDQDGKTVSSIDKKGRIIQVSYKVKPEATVSNAKGALHVS